MTEAIGISIGDVWGISPEIIVKATQEFLKINKQTNIRIYADTKGFEALCQQQNIDVLWQDCIQQKNLQFQPLSKSVLCAQKDEHSRAQIAKESLDLGIEEALNHKISALVTAPLDKRIMGHVIKGFAGHTEYLKEKSAAQNTWMMLDNGELKVVLLTNHLLLKEVPQAITVEKIKQGVKDIYAHFEKQKKGSINIAVCALNPHCGELSRQSEEKTVIEPAIESLQQEGYRVEGPFSADALFAKARNNSRWTAVLAMYHDQGLVASKYPDKDSYAINITLGLPFTRVSPGHGVAYDLVGKNQADFKSMQKAIVYAYNGLH